MHFHNSATYLQVIQIELVLRVFQAFLFLDYGSFYDSPGDKVSWIGWWVVGGWWLLLVSMGQFGKLQVHCLVFIVVTAELNCRPPHKSIVIFFDSETDAKDAATGAIWHHLLAAPTSGGPCLFKQWFPNVTELFVSGDTGNGFRCILCPHGKMRRISL